MIHSRDTWQVRLRALLLTLVTLAALTGCLLGALAVARRTTHLVAVGTARPFEELLVLSCTAAVALAGTWLCTLVLIAVVPLLRHGRVTPGRSVRAPRRVAVLVAGVCGLALGAAPVGAQESHPEAVRPAQLTSVLHGLPLPSRPVEAQVEQPRASRPVVRPVVGLHRVRPGESLWSIAAAELGPAATRAAVHARWQAIHAANATAIPDPDLIRVDALLRLPAPSTPPKGTP